jgi:RimJ/RimL family protein N-acetyltransferase
MIERKSDDMILWEIWIHEIHQRNQTCELGINLFCEEFRGKWYGTDALEIIIQYAFWYLSFRKITVQIYAMNEASIRIFEKCGFTYSWRFRAERLYRWEYIDTLIYEKFRDTEYTNTLGDIT